MTDGWGWEGGADRADTEQDFDTLKGNINACSTWDETIAGGD